MKKYISIILLCCIFIPKMALAKVYSCSNAQIEIEKDEISLGEATLINIKSSNSYNVTYTPSVEGYLSINSGIIRGEKDGKVNLNVHLEFLNNLTGDNECSVSIPITVLSNDATLKSLNIAGTDLASRFRSNIYDYEVNVPYSIESVNINGEANSEKSQVTGFTESYLNIGENEYKVVVKAENGMEATYNIKVIRGTPNNDAYLKDLIVEGFVLTPKFNKDTLKYTLEVGKDIETINVKGIPSNSLTKVNGTGTFTLNTGKNTFFIYTSAEDNSSMKYELEVVKKTGSSRLKDLKINGFNLDTEFNSDKFIYYLSTEENINKLDIEAVGEDENDEVTFIGNDKLKNGLNDIYVKVTNKDKTTTTYRIVVEKIKTNNMGNNILLIILFIMFVLAVITMVTLLAIFINNNYVKRYKLKKVNKKVR